MKSATVDKKSERDLAADLGKLEKMAFGRARHCGPLVKRFHELKGKIEETGRAESIWKLYDWLLTPFMMWPQDFEGMTKQVLSEIEDGRWEMGEAKTGEGRREKGEGKDGELDLLLGTLPEAPPERAQKVIGRFEPEMESGRYDPMLKQRAKYEEQERALLQDKELMAMWGWIKERFDVSKYQNSRGVIRRRVSGERNFREGWHFDWSSERGRFQHVFDGLCYRWNLYGMEYDKPLLLKLTANPTAHGTLIMVPRNMSFDPYRDVDWGLIAELHRAWGASKQGPKLSAGRNEKVGDAKKAKRLWEEARRNGMKGEARYDYVRERMGKDVRANKAWLWRLLNSGKGRG